MSPAPHDKSNNSPDFGANDWLIEEMRDQYQSDPNSIDPAWATFFRKEAVESTDSVTKSAASEQPAAKDVPGASAPKPATKPQPVPATKPAPITAKPQKQPPRLPMSADAPRHSAKLETVEPTVTKMKGAPMRTAKNMDQSLTMPTATTVRDVPMQLVIEQRTMICLLYTSPSPRDS